MFKAPAEKHNFDEWKKAIPKRDMDLNQNSYVCSKHFHKEEVLWFWTSGEGNSIIKVFI